MAPPVESWSASELPDRVQVTADGRRRKDRIELGKCALLQMVQYECFVLEERKPGAPVVCRPVERLFRRCKDRNGTFTVETTAWEESGGVRRGFGDGNG